jgi:hypothetical protein
MNTDALAKRYGQIPAAIQHGVTQVWDHLQKQSDKVISVEFLANFNKDHDMSLRHDTNIYKGVVVTVKPDYALDDSDMLWMHPQAYQCRAVYEGGTMTHVELPDMNAAVGTYNTSTVDDIGTPVNTLYTIVDTRMPFVRAASTPQEAYDNANKHATLDHCTEIAAAFGCDKLVDHVFTNLFLKGSGQYAFYNHAFMKKGIVHVSPLMGYRSVAADGNFDSDCFAEEEYVNIGHLSTKQQEHLFGKCEWDGRNTVNTYVFRRPYTKMTNIGTHYRLEYGTFASTPIHDKMAIAALYNLTPDLTRTKITGFGERTKETSIRMPVTHAIMQRLMDIEGFDIINPEYMADGVLNIPRNVVHQLI